MLKRLALAFLAVTALSSTASARALTDDDWAALEELVIAHETALHEKDAGTVIDHFPPAVLPLIAQMSGGVTPDEARQQGIDAMMQSAEGASFDAYDIDYDNADGPYELSDGTTYVLLPTTAIELPGDGSVLKQEVSVAVLIEDQWYLIGFDDTTEAQLLFAAYPAFAEPDFATNFAAVYGTEPATSTETTAPVPAVTITNQQLVALEARISAFGEATRANDMAGIMGVIPPRMLAHIAAQYGVTVEQAIEAGQQAMDEMFKTMTLVSYGMDVETATVAAQADGSPYLLIPTETVIDLGESTGKVRVSTQTLALMEDDIWYLIRVDDPSQVAIVKELFPGLADVEFPSGTMEPVTE